MTSQYEITSYNMTWHDITNDSGLQGFELRGKVGKVRTNNTREKEEQRRLNRNLEDYYWKGINIVGEAL